MQIGSTRENFEHTNEIRIHAVEPWGFEYGLFGGPIKNRKPDKPQLGLEVSA